MKHITPFALFELFSLVKKTVWHGGKLLTNIKDSSLFTTTDMNVAGFYANGCSGYVTELEITYKNPLTLYSKAEFESKWIPIMDEVGIEYTYTFSKDEWTFKSEELNRMDLIEANPYDMLYIKRFEDAVKSKGYDCVTGYDGFLHYDSSFLDDSVPTDKNQNAIDIYVPLYKKDIKIITAYFWDEAPYPEIEY
jgi:hypothetical protein